MKFEMKKNGGNFLFIFFLTLFLTTSSLFAQNTMRAYAYGGSLWHRHESVDIGREMLKNFAQKYQFELVMEENPANEGDLSVFTDFNLSQYDVLILNNADMVNSQLNPSQRDALQNFIDNGGGLVGWHGAVALQFPDIWPWYHETLRSIWDVGKIPFQGQPNLVKTGNHAATDSLPNEFGLSEVEWYSLDSDPSLKEGVDVLIHIDETNPGLNSNAALTWASTFRNGRVWMSVLGHAINIYNDKNFQDMVWGGIEWAAGWNEPTAIERKETNGRLQLNTDNLIMEIGTTLIIKDVSGKELVNKIYNTSANYNLNQLRSGVYFISLNGPMVDFKTKIIRF